MTSPLGSRASIHPSGPVRILVERPEPLLELLVRGGDGSLETVSERLSQTLTDAFLVIHDGVLVLEWYADPITREVPHAVMSVTKSVVGCVAGVLVGRGRLEPDQPVARCVPEVATTGYAAVTIRDLLDMRTGTDYRESHDDVDGELAQLGLCLSTDHPMGLHDLVLGSPRIGVHNGPFCYRSLDTELLGWVLERAAHKPIPELVEQTILTPMGAEFDASMALDPQGTASASGGLGLTARDTARFAQMLLDGGAVGRRQVVPTEWIKDIRIGGSDSVEAFTHGVTAGHAEEVPSPRSAMYRNQFWVPEQGGHKFLALGIYGQYVYVDGDAGTVVVKLSSWKGPQDPQRFTDGLACAEAITDELGGNSARDISLFS